jgi:toxin CcdB
MAQFDVFDNVNPDTHKAVPFLLDVQADILTDLATRVVVPLMTASAMGRPATTLNPQFAINGVPVVMSTAELAGIDKRILGAKVGSLSDRRDEILAALDFLITGF